MASDQTVFVIDDEEAVRDSISMMLERRRYTVLAFASAEDYLRAALQPGLPRCSVCDVRRGGLSGRDLHRKLSESRCHFPVIFITGHGDIEMAVMALKRGAFDFIEKPFEDTRLYASVELALSAGRDLLSKEEELVALQRRIDELTARQREVMEYLTDGLSNKEIGRRLEISPRTVETYRALVMARMGATSLAELVKMSIRVGIRS
jgi:FixJ family two-component response regulator